MARLCQRSEDYAGTAIFTLSGRASINLAEVDARRSVPVPALELHGIYVCWRSHPDTAMGTSQHLLSA